MKVAELIALLQKADQDSEVKLVAGHDDVLCLEQITIEDNAVEINLYDFVDDENDFNEMCSAL